MSLLNSLANAGHGFILAWKKESNIRIQIFFATLASLFGWILGVSQAEWLAIITMIGLVIALELCNTALEKLLDLVKPRLTEQAAAIKDIAAAAVLVAALASFLVASTIFIPRIIERWL